MAEYAHGGPARAKSDGSPVTAADERAEATIRERLAAWAAPIPIVAEEATAAGAPIAVAERFVLVDPLDGTREFIARNGEFTVNVALIERRPADRRRGLRSGARAVVVRRRARFRLPRAGRRRPAAAADVARAERFAPRRRR